MTYNIALFLLLKVNLTVLKLTLTISSVAKIARVNSLSSAWLKADSCAHARVLEFCLASNQRQHRWRDRVHADTASSPACPSARTYVLSNGALATGVESQTSNEVVSHSSVLLAMSDDSAGVDSFEVLAGWERRRRANEQIYQKSGEERTQPFSLILTELERWTQLTV